MGTGIPRKIYRVSVGLLCAAALCLATAHPAFGRRTPEPANVPYGAYVLGRLAEGCGFGEDVRLFRGPVTYAQAAVIDDREVILYNSRSLDDLERGSGTPWSAVSVIAHELGHIYYGHAEAGLTNVRADEILRCEMDADYFSGFALARVGASLKEAQAAQRSLDSEETLFHPASSERLRAIEAGWRDAREGLPIADFPSERVECMPLTPNESASADLCVSLQPQVGRW